MKLAAYLTERHLTIRGFARRAKVDPSMLWRVLTGKRRPNLTMLEKIRDASEGEVLPEDFMSPVENLRT